MQIDLQADSPVPLYHRLYLVLRQKISDGEFPVDRPMPSEQEIVQQSGLSRVTVRKALDRLESEALIHRRRGKGTFVRDDNPAPKFEASLSGLLDNMLAMGLKTKVDLLEFQYITPSLAIQHDMNIGSSDVVQRAVRIRKYKGEPLCHLTTHVPERIGKTYKQEDLSDQPLLRLLERSGVTAVEADERITARLADPDVAGLLNVELGSPLLLVTRVTLDRDGNAVEHLRALFRPDMYEYHLKMSRNRGETAGHWKPESH